MQWAEEAQRDDLQPAAGSDEVQWWAVQDGWLLHLLQSAVSHGAGVGDELPEMVAPRPDSLLLQPAVRRFVRAACSSDPTQLLVPLRFTEALISCFRRMLWHAQVAPQDSLLGDEYGERY